MLSVGVHARFTVEKTFVFYIFVLAPHAVQLLDAMERDSISCVTKKSVAWGTSIMISLYEANNFCNPRTKLVESTNPKTARQVQS